jgi:YHS domain-containing protein
MARRYSVKRAPILCATLLALAACSTNKRLLAPDSEAKHVSPEKPAHAKKVVDPVCGMAVDSSEAYWHSTYQGAEFYFDSEECRKQFEENPDLFGASVR